MILALAAGMAALVAAGPARAALSECIDATCRITAADGSRGSGCVFEITRGSVFVLTAAHVVGNNPAVQCEFWHQGHQSAPLWGRIIGRSEAVDAAIIAVPETALGGILPAAIPLAPRNSEIRPGTTLTSVGCAGGAWSTSWKGHALAGDDGQLHFVPTPANGRSGSAIFDAQGEHIVAVLRARTVDDSEGIATPVQAIYRVFDVAASSTAAAVPTQCCPDGCCPNGCCPNGICPNGCCPNGICPLPQPCPNHLPPYRDRQDSPAPQAAPRASAAWPSAPADLSRMDEKLGRIAALLEDLKKDTEAGAAAQQHAPGVTPPTGPERPKPVADEQARKTAEAALEQVADLRTAAERDVRELKIDAAKTNQAVGGLTTAVEKIKESIEDSGTVAQRFHARVEKVKTELEDKLGHEASDREVRIAYVRDLIQDKLGDGGALRGLLLPAALAVAVWLIARDVKNHRASGDPLAVERLTALVEGKVVGLQDRVDAIKDRLQAAATPPAAPPPPGMRTVDSDQWAAGSGQ
jgi:hypothetical protein